MVSLDGHLSFPDTLTDTTIIYLLSYLSVFPQLGRSVNSLLF